MRKDGSIISRHWTLIADGNAPRWAIARAKNDPPDGWSPKPGLANLKFLPPLEPKLKDGASQYLAYAPLLGENFDEVQKLGTINEVFGDAQGTFDWRGRKYGYALTSKLPCYPILQ